MQPYIKFNDLINKYKIVQKSVIQKRRLVFINLKTMHRKYKKSIIQRIDLVECLTISRSGN